MLSCSLIYLLTHIGKQELEPGQLPSPLVVGHESYVTFCQLEDEAAFTCSADCTIRRWDVRTGQCRQVYRGHTSIVNRSAKPGPWSRRQKCRTDLEQCSKLLVVAGGLSRRATGKRHHPQILVCTSPGATHPDCRLGVGRCGNHSTPDGSKFQRRLLT